MDHLMTLGKKNYDQCQSCYAYTSKMNQLREFIDKRQAELGLSQNQVAKMAGRSNTWLNRFMSGERKDIKLDSLIALASALQVPESTLIAAYKGLEVDSEVESLTDSKKILMDVVKQIPGKMVFDAMSDDEIFKALLASKGEAKMRELMQEALRRNQNK